MLGIALPDNHPSPVRGGAFLRSGGNAIGRFGRAREPRPFAFDTGGFLLRLQPKGLPQDSVRFRYVHRDLVAACVGRSAPQALAKGIGNSSLHGQLERLAASHPRQVPGVGRADRDAERLVAHDRVFEVHAVQVGEEGQHVEERRFPAGVRPDQHLEGAEPLRYVAEGAESKGFDPRHGEAVAFGLRRAHYAPSECPVSDVPGSTASQAASSHPWNTNAKPTYRTEGAHRRNPSSAK